MTDILFGGSLFDDPMIHDTNTCRPI